MTDARLLGEMFAGCLYVIHLATGSARGWEGLLDVDVDGTRMVFEQAAEAGARRIVFASTNHVAGGLELDVVGGRQSADGPIAVVRPDSPYGAAKAFGEAFGRFIAETTGTAVSCLRIGSVRSTSELDDYDVAAELLPPEVAAYAPPELLTPAALHARLRRTWLTHEDLIEIVDEELAATNQFRLRWAVSDNPERVWPLDPYTWDDGAP